VSLGLVLVACLSAPMPASGADVETYAVVKGQSFSQTSSAAPTPIPTSSFQFVSLVDLIATNSATGATVQLPGGTTKTLLKETSSFNFSDGFASQADRKSAE